MNTLSGVRHGEFSPQDILAKIDDRFQALDADQSGSLTKSELVDARSAKGLDTSRIDKIFAWLDMDGNAVVSQQEHENRSLAVAERRGLVRQHGGYPRVPEPSEKMPYIPPQFLDALNTLVASVDSASISEDQTLRLEQLSGQIEAEGFSAETLALVTFLASMVPHIDAEV